MTGFLLFTEDEDLGALNLYSRIRMDARHLTEEQAFDVLRRYSQEKNIKLREVARLICAQGNL